MPDNIDTLLRDPITALIVVCEVGFWVVLAAGLAVRYGLRRHRLSLLLLLLSPVLDLVLLVVTTVDLLNGGQAGFGHGLAAGYIAGTIVWGHRILRWADQRVAHRFAGGPPPQRPPKYGAAKVRHEWAEWGRAVMFWAIACALLGVMILVINDSDRTAVLAAWIGRYTVVVAIWFVVDPLWVTLSPPRDPKAQSGSEAERSGRTGLPFAPGQRAGSGNAGVRLPPGDALAGPHGVGHPQRPDARQ
jgi:hypothetical protein